MTTFPDFHFPRFVPSREEGSELPDAFGCFHSCGVCNVKRLQFRFQYGNKSTAARLVPQGLCIPYLPPNEDSAALQPTYKDYMKRTSSLKRLITNVTDQADYGHANIPDLFLGPFHGLLAEDELPTSVKAMTTLRQKDRLNNFLSEIIDELTSVGVQRPLLCRHLKEELDAKIWEMYQGDKFYGGCLSYTPFPFSIVKDGDPCGFLFYPSGRLLDKVNVHTLEAESKRATFPILKPSSRVSQIDVGHCVRQISSLKLPGRVGILAGIRTDYRCCVMKSTLKTKVDCNILHDIQCQKRVTSLCLSPHIPGEALFSDETGGVHVVDPQTCVYSSANSTKHNPVFSHYSAHPRLMFTHSREQAYQLDFRIGGTPSTIPLFSLPNGCLPSDQFFCVAQQHPTNPCYHCLATQHHLILVDERFPQHVVLQWAHLLSSPPNVITIVPPLSSSSSSSASSVAYSDDLILLGSHSAREVHCFQYSCSTGRCPEARNQPWKLQDNDAWLDAMSALPNRGLDCVKNRLCCPLIGLSTARLRTDDGNSGLTVFQMSKAGDIYHQVLRVTDRPDDKDLSDQLELDPASEQRCRDFVAKVIDIELKRHPEQTSNNAIGGEKIGCQEILNVLEEHDPCPHCALCGRGSDMVTEPQSRVPCARCGLAPKEAEALVHCRPTDVLTSAKVIDSTRSEATVQRLKQRVTTKHVRGQLAQRLYESWHQGDSTPRTCAKRRRASVSISTPQQSTLNKPVHRSSQAKRSNGKQGTSKSTTPEDTARHPGGTPSKSAGKPKVFASRIPRESIPLSSKIMVDDLRRKFTPKKVASTVGF